MSRSVEPRRLLRSENISVPSFAMLVRDFHDGGLEKVVIDLARELSGRGIKCPILVSGSAGRAAASAAEMGCEIEVFNGDVDALAACVRERGVQAVHVSFDLDALDPLVFPATGVTVPGGLTYREAHLLMELLHDDGRVRSLDLVEINPILDTANQTAQVAVDLAASLFGQQIL